MSTHILVVDDNPLNLKLASEVLEFEGYQVSRAENADQALAQLDTNRPDLILMDISMPGMDGLTLTQKLKAHPATRDIVIVILTASAMAGDEAKAKGAGCDGYITKPIDTRSFPAQVASYLAANKKG